MCKSQTAFRFKAFVQKLRTKSTDDFVESRRVHITHLISTDLTSSHLTSFSPLGKLAGRAIYFTLRFFLIFFPFFIIFFNDFSETNYLKIHWTDFRNLYIESKHFGRR